jgi:hypothetical protein
VLVEIQYEVEDLFHRSQNAYWDSTSQRFYIKYGSNKGLESKRRKSLTDSDGGTGRSER